MTDKKQFDYVAPEEQALKKKRKKKVTIKKDGRPTNYRESLNEKVNKYLKTCVDEITEFHKTRGEKSDTYERILKVNLPSIVGFGIYAGVPESTLYDWRDKHLNFSESLAKIVDAQKLVLMTEGLSGNYNASIAKLILSANHNMVEKKEFDHTSKGKQIKGFNYIDPNDTNDQTDN